MSQSNDDQRRGHTQNPPQPSRSPTPTANTTSFMWPPLMAPHPFQPGGIFLSTWTLFPAKELVGNEGPGWFWMRAPTLLLASLRASPTSGPRTFWLGMGPTLSPHPRQPLSGSSSVASFSGASPSFCGLEPSSASWPTASRLPWRMNRPMTM